MSFSAPVDPDALAAGRQCRDAMRADGHVTIESLLPGDLVMRLRRRLTNVLNRRYQTGIFPDESYYRPGATLPDVPRHVVNAWKCDREVAAIAASPELAAVAAGIFGWPSLRLAVDTVWSKPGGSIGVDYHREFEYFTSLAPDEVASCWIALDDMGAENGTLEFATGSHLWPPVSQPAIQEIFAARAGRAALAALADVTGNAARITQVACAAGGATFFHGRAWHGSEANRSTAERMAYGIHWVRGDAVFAGSPTYLFGRYKLAGSNALHDSFFPLIWSETGERSQWIDAFIAGGPLGG